MRQVEQSEVRELLQIALLIFSAVSLATLEFIRNAFPVGWRWQASTTSVVYLIVLVMVVPALLLLLADRVIAARDKSGRVLRWFRTGLFVVALLLILRQLQLYWGLAEDLTEEVRSTSLALLVVMDIAVLAVVVLVSARLHNAATLFFYYMAPIAIVMTAIIPFQVPTQVDRPGYSQEVANVTDAGSKPAVFVLVFDALAYEALLKDGDLDVERFPNFAALADDGAWFTNATANRFWTTEAVPRIVNQVKSASDQFDLRFYLQFRLIEDMFIADCGKLYTCRGAHYLTQSDPLWLASNLALRSFYEAAPEPVETALKGPMIVLADGLDSPYPPADPDKAHALSKRQFEVLLGDIEATQSMGRIHVLHSLLPHLPAVFSDTGTPVGPTSTSFSPGDAVYDDLAFENFRKQVMFVDSLVGKLIDKLKQEGIYEESVIVVTGDHGLRRVNPLAGGPIEVDSLMVRVPLLIRAPGLNGDISDVDYQHMDFGLTLADVLGLPPPEDSQGVSAFSEERHQRDKVFEVSATGREGPLWTYIYNPEDDGWHLIDE